MNFSFSLSIRDCNLNILSVFSHFNVVSTIHKFHNLNKALSSHSIINQNIAHICRIFPKTSLSWNIVVATQNQNSYKKFMSPELTVGSELFVYRAYQVIYNARKDMMSSSKRFRIHQKHIYTKSWKTYFWKYRIYCLECLLSPNSFFLIRPLYIYCILYVSFDDITFVASLIV